VATISKYSEFFKSSKKFFTEHDKIEKSFDINFIYNRNVKIPLICLYSIVDNLFKNNSKILKYSDIILLTLTATAILSKENSKNIKKLLDELKKRGILRHIGIVKKLLKFIKNLSNIVLKKYGLIIQNIEQFLNSRYSIQILNLLLDYIINNNLKIKDFSYWYIVDNRDLKSKKILIYIDNQLRF